MAGKFADIIVGASNIPSCIRQCWCTGRLPKAAIDKHAPAGSCDVHSISMTIFESPLKSQGAEPANPGYKTAGAGPLHLMNIAVPIVLYCTAIRGRAPSASS